MRFLITFSLFLFCISVLQAQEAPSRFRLGLSASLEGNVSSKRMAFSEYTGFSVNYDKTNYRLGTIMEYELKNNLSLNAAIQYSNKDFTGTYFCDVCDFVVPPSPEDVDFAFIEVPLTVKYYFLPNTVRLFGEARINNLFALDDVGYEARMNPLTIGFKIGGGIELGLNEKIALQLLFDYNNSLTKLFKDSYFEDPYFMLRSFNFGIVLLKKI
ncbi:outer membrane beta-barrel protein [Ulvibacterium marinum]|uniref:outer membrane beta-barrel protein n=1 Tax=Ulvibacterium marinum TaxID=2419782 RepID=UPI002495018D|nr:outer membrane beta-barrel protein [Ulvibacterium marinum]